MMSVKLSSNC